MADERLSYLFNRYRARTCTNAERQELALLCLLPENQAVIEELLDGAWEQTSLDEDMPDDKGALILQRILSPSLQASAPETGRVRRLLWRRVAVAASLIFVVGLGAYFMFFNKQKYQQPPVVINNDVPAPSSNKAVITLPDGKLISLDTLSTYTQGSVTVTKTADGRLVYTGFGSEVRFNTLTNPRGSKVIDMQLSDGSHVWLNAGSSVTYPIAFTGNERTVTMNGEAYFEVAHDASKPFTVSKNDMKVTVLGTKFNVNAYDDEDNIKVTLLEGSVKATPAPKGESKILKPGQQASITAGHASVSSNVNLEEVMAWKNGLFVFKDAKIETIMRQVSRWYDVEVVYEGPQPDVHFVGDMARTENVSEVLKMLELTKAVKFRIENKKIVVSK